MLGISALHCDSLTHEVLGFLDLHLDDAVLGTSFAIFRNELTLGGGAHTPESARLWEEKHQQPSVSAD